MQDSVIDNKLLAQREQQFKELFLSEFGRMYKAAYILLGDEDEAKDAVQDVFAKLWDGTSPLKEESQRTYLLTCVRNRCLNIIAQRQTRQKAARRRSSRPSTITSKKGLPLRPVVSSACTSMRKSLTRRSPARWVSVSRQSISTLCKG